MDRTEAPLAVASHNGWVAPCLSGVELLIFPASGDATSAGPEAAREALTTEGWGLPDWARELHARDVEYLICSAADPFLAGMLAGYGITVAPGPWESAADAAARFRRGIVPDVGCGARGCGRGGRRRRNRMGRPPWAGFDQPWGAGRGRRGGRTA